MCKVIQVSNECFGYVRSFQTTEGSCKYKKSQKGSIDPDFFQNYIEKHILYVP